MYITYANKVESRYKVRVNDDDVQLQWLNIDTRTWSNIETTIRNNYRGVIIGEQQGQRIHVLTTRGCSSVVVFADVNSHHIIGHIDVNENGRISIHGGPSNLNVLTHLNEYWQANTLAIIGIPGDCTLNFVNVRDNNDVDVLRYKRGHYRWCVPGRYLKPTIEYDLVEDPASRAEASTPTASRCSSVVPKTDPNALAGPSRPPIEPDEANRTSDPLNDEDADESDISQPNVRPTPTNDYDDDDDEMSIISGMLDQPSKNE